jgi:hypothetical protein
MGETRKIAAILVADVVGYSRLAGADEDRTLSRLRGLRSDLIDPAIAAHHGLIVMRTGDGSIIGFRSVVDAVRCAIEVQKAMVQRNAGVPADRCVEFRIGIHLGDVVEESDGELIAKASTWPRPCRAGREAPADGITCEPQWRKRSTCNIRRRSLNRRPWSPSSPSEPASCQRLVLETCS